MPAGDRWRARDPGPAVRPYAVTGGRTEPADGEPLDLLAVVVAVGDLPAERALLLDQGLTPEHRRILAVCRHRSTVADAASDVGLPVGVVRVLIGDLIQAGLVSVARQRTGDEQISHDMLQEILNGLRTL